jgi:NADP-dependent 3-hydroxy acid dehydrogenase YdfG
VEKKSEVYAGIQPMTAEDVAEVIFWTCTLPAHININRLQLQPVMQAFGPIVAKRR